ncbi:MAG: hypothetical protein KJ619_07480 [Candidatus Omnitrophica bacterium]|nr:hypothetical protein [Candidatus Omnitrophota bacterium]
MTEILQKYLLEAVGKNRQDLPETNIYREIGFDGNSKRLGWVKPASFSRIKQSLQDILPILEGKEIFIFVGMGGSINGIKPLISLLGPEQCYVLDNLDPRAISSLAAGLKNFSKTLVVLISKSGTTKETQLLAKTLQELFCAQAPGERQKNFLWLSDPSSFDKLNSLGWQEVAKAAIQFDSQSDIGGRFSSPNTLIFFLPLFLLLKKDFSRLEKTYNLFLSFEKAIKEEAYQKASACKDKPEAYFSPLIDPCLGESFSSWIIQLFQESLGSKDPKLSVKTIPNLKGQGRFCPLKLDLKINDKSVELIAQMYFFQVFIAYYSAFKKINFVSQDYVEEYKQQMRRLEGEARKELKIQAEDLASLARKIKPCLSKDFSFIEVVLYFDPQPGQAEAIKDFLEKEFNDKQVLVFIGSDWNHQSYQAAFGAKDTFYLLLVLSDYPKSLVSLPDEILDRNIEALRLIAQATYLTIKDKSVLAALK